MSADRSCIPAAAPCPLLHRRPATTPRCLPRRTDFKEQPATESAGISERHHPDVIRNSRLGVRDTCLGYAVSRASPIPARSTRCPPSRTWVPADARLPHNGRMYYADQLRRMPRRSRQGRRASDEEGHKNAPPLVGVGGRQTDGYIWGNGSGMAAAACRRTNP
jgi:hypothetical protein